MSGPTFDADLVRAVGEVYGARDRGHEVSEEALALVQEAREAARRIRLDVNRAAEGDLGAMAAQLRELGPDALRLLALEQLLAAEDAFVAALYPEGDDDEGDS